MSFSRCYVSFVFLGLQGGTVRPGRYVKAQFGRSLETHTNIPLGPVVSQNFLCITYLGFISHPFSSSGSPKFLRTKNLATHWENPLFFHRLSVWSRVLQWKIIRRSDLTCLAIEQEVGWFWISPLFFLAVVSLWLILFLFEISHLFSQIWYSDLETLISAMSSQIESLK